MHRNYIKGDSCSYFNLIENTENDTSVEESETLNEEAQAKRQELTSDCPHDFERFLVRSIKSKK